MIRLQRNDSLQLLSGERTGDGRRPLDRILDLIGVCRGTSDEFIRSLPFCPDDVTAGTENELQAVVEGKKPDVDLPIMIEHSDYYANILKRVAAGDTSKAVVADLHKYMADNSRTIWENSWVRFPLKTLSDFARETLDHDLLADKSRPKEGVRGDIERFIFFERGEKYLRIPISYLLKLSLADALGSQTRLPPSITDTGRHILSHFSNDNTSPEVSSFYVIPLQSGRSGARLGVAVAREAAKRFLLTQLLAMYANAAFGLLASGQRAMVYAAPNPPARQRELNECISDAFYRELFMSPCLSGWERGEEKHAYMGLCHRVLSRSQLNAIGKLKEAGIIVNNLVVLPNTSNICLANNGTHLSLGSRRLTELRKDSLPGSGITGADEKFLGDLVIKIVEHFLPLFVGAYTAAPYRLDFGDFHPERVLGFLPHELDYTHLRMLWRRWKKKADLKIFGHPVTPFGPRWLDRAISMLFRLRGDFLPDFRLIDYFVSLMSTDRSPALDGKVGNGEKLKGDLANLGVFDSRIALYYLYRLREFDKMGFCGFEGRHYSLFQGFGYDMANAAELQVLVTALAYKYIARGEITHAHIPDTPSVESERRQIFFGTAIGVPTFYVRKDTTNLFLRGIVEFCGRVRQSKRYPGYLRVYNHEYRKALVRMVRKDAGDLIEMMGLGETMGDLSSRVDEPELHSASGRLTRSILNDVGASSPMSLSASEFNGAAENYYRDSLRKEYLREAFAMLEDDVWALDSSSAGDGWSPREEIGSSLGEMDPAKFIASVKDDILEETATIDELKALINLVLITLRQDMRQAAAVTGEFEIDEHPQTPVHRAAHW